MTGPAQEDASPTTPEGHILSRFDGDLGYFRGLVLNMGSRVHSQVARAGEALVSCDAAKARKVIREYRDIRDIDIEAQEANARLFAIHKPVARDLRFVLTLSRTVYDLERINGETLRLADIAEALYERPPSVNDLAIFEDVRRIAVPAGDLLERSLQAVANEDLHLAAEVVFDGKDLEHIFRGAVRRLATYLMEDPRNIRYVIDATLGIKAMERIGDHACSIARNLIFSVTGKDVRHVHTASLGSA